MIRPFTLLTAIIFLVSGAYMFAVKHRAEATEVRIAQIDQQSRLDASRIRVLQAQWALEADPDRLSQLAAAFTHLTPMKPAQLVTLAALAHALPAPGAVVPGQNPQETAPVTVPDAAVADAAAPAANSPAATVALPLPPDAAPGPAPLRLAAAAPAPALMKTAASAAPVRTASLNNVEHLLHHLNVAPVASRPRAVPHDVRVARAMPPVHHQMAPAAPDGAQVVATRAMVSPPLGGGSLLGMAQPGVGN